MGKNNKPTNLQYGNIDYSVYQNIDQKLITITEDKLRLILIDYENQKNILSDWISPFGILITLIITWVTTDFREALGLSKDCWQAVFVIATLIVLLWLFKTIWHIIVLKKSNKATIDSILEEIKTNKPAT